MPERIDSLLHIAGVVELGPVGELTPKAWHFQLNANLIAPAETHPPPPARSSAPPRATSSS